MTGDVAAESTTGRVVTTAPLEHDIGRCACVEMVSGHGAGSIVASCTVANVKARTRVPTCSVRSDVPGNHTAVRRGVMTGRTGGLAQGRGHDMATGTGRSGTPTKSGTVTECAHG